MGVGVIKNPIAGKWYIDRTVPNVRMKVKVIKVKPFRNPNQVLVEDGEGKRYVSWMHDLFEIFPG